jgi:tyrosyl-tRNA synthetase
VKVLLAQEIVSASIRGRPPRMPWRISTHASGRALFRRISRKSALPAEPKACRLRRCLKQAGLTGSTSEALRMIEQGGVRLDGEKVSDRALILKPGTTVVLQVGKRKFARVSLS